jgi:hypothetical protein
VIERLCRSRAGARHGMCELTNGMAGERHGRGTLCVNRPLASGNIGTLGPVFTGGFFPRKRYRGVKLKTKLYRVFYVKHEWSCNPAAFYMPSYHSHSALPVPLPFKGPFNFIFPSVPRSSQ